MRRIFLEDSGGQNRSHREGRTGSASAFQSSLSRVEKAVLGAALLGLFTTGILLFDEPFYRFFAGGEGGSSQVSIGSIIEQQNDTRLKRQRSFAWLPSYFNAKLRGGDSVFTGQDSSATIALHSGESLLLKPNSLVSFREVSGVTIPQLDLGVFQIEAKGRVRVAIRGQVTEIDGTDSKVEIQIEDKKPVQVRVMEGRALVKAKELPGVELSPESQPVTLAAPMTQLDFVETHLAPPEERVKMQTFQIELRSGDSADVDYVLKLSDVYDEPAPHLLIPRRADSVLPSATVARNWDSMDGAEAPKWIQISPTRDFAAGFTDVLSGLGSSYIFKKVWRGENHWRVSTNGVTWSKALHFRVRDRTLASRPKVPFKSKQVFLQENVIDFRIQVESISNASGYVLETSMDAKFPPGKTQVTWSPVGEFPFEVSSPGTQFHRLRFFTVQSELSAYSDTFSVQFTVPPPIQLMPLSHHSAVSQEAGSAEVPSAQASSAEASVSGLPPERDPSSVSKEVGATEEPELSGSRRSRFSLEGVLFTMLSSHQVDATLPNASGAMSAVGFETWWSSLGLDAKLKAKLFGTNETAKKASPQAAEMKVMRESKQRLSSVLIPELNWLFFGGLELYRNPDAGSFFSPKYDVFKGGLGLRIPVGQVVTTGGDLTFGMGTERSRKYEIGGFLDYSFNSAWSLGAGYRLHLFDSQSEATSPTSFPHREAYIEGFSALKWSY